MVRQRQGGYNKRIENLLGALVLLAGLLGRAPAAVSDHGAGGKLHVSAAPLDPYLVDVWTAPGILRPGEVHVETLITQDGRPVTDCIVRVQMDRQGDEPALVAWAGAPDPANGFRQEAAFQVEQTGVYQVAVSVRDPAGQGGELSFAIKVSRLPVWLAGAIYLQLAVAVLFGIWFIRQGMRLFLMRKR